MKGNVLHITSFATFLHAEQPGSAVNLRYILEWAWNKVVHTKEELDEICEFPTHFSQYGCIANLKVFWSCAFYSSRCSTLWQLSKLHRSPDTAAATAQSALAGKPQHHFPLFAKWGPGAHTERCLSILKSTREYVKLKITRMTDYFWFPAGLIGLMNKCMVSSLISQYAQVVLWFCRTGLLPEGFGMTVFYLALLSLCDFKQICALHMLNSVFFCQQMMKMCCRYQGPFTVILL